MQKIDGSPKSLKQLLQNTKYTIHYYQREYMWQRKNIEELVDDLTSEFLDFYQAGDPRTAVASYGVYFMGSVVLAGRENAIIDGQQRLSSLTLLMIYLNNRLKKLGQSHKVIGEMIYSESYGVASFNINVEDRQACMKALYDECTFETEGQAESVQNLYSRYQDICEIFPEEVDDAAILHFCDWLADKVQFIEIVAQAEQDAHKVFVLMNDRGLSLTSTGMLKGYLLSEIADDHIRKELNDLWKSKVELLKKTDETGKGDEVFIKAWLRAQYAVTIRENRADSDKRDFDIIGGPFHKWVRDEHTKLGLNSTVDFEEFIRSFARFADAYIQIRKAEAEYVEETRYVYYNAKVDFTLQPMLILAALTRDDGFVTVREKMSLVARFLDLLIIARVVRYKSVDYSTMKNYIFSAVKDIRRASVPELKSKLLARVNDLAFDPEKELPGFGLNNFSKKYIKHMLARVTSFIEEATDVASNYPHYMDKATRNPFEIEHIVCDHFEWFESEYADQEDFRRWRNNIGDLLLLRKSINASLSDEKYAVKLVKYCSNEGNIYSESLGHQAYVNNPRFKRFVEENALPFVPYEVFGKEQIADRRVLFAKLMRFVWNTDDFN